MKEMISEVFAPENGAIEEAVAVITNDDVAKAEEERKKYREGKKSLEDRIVSEEKAWRLKLYDGTKNGSKTRGSAYMWSSVVSKHADMMDNYPEPIFLPREESDAPEAKKLSSVVPVILDRNDFEAVYSDSEWYRIKHGTSCIGVFWDPAAEEGRGDIAVRNIDLLNVFYKAGIKDIQESPNLFICAECDRDSVKAEYPFAELSGSGADTLADYDSDEKKDKSKSVLVVDWYYKKRVNGKTVVHLCKYSCGEVLYASENDPETAATGFYSHGLYPVVFNTLYPEEDSCTGYGLIAVSINAQLYIDELDSLVMSYAKTALTPRWFAKKSAGINIGQYEDESAAIVEVEGDIDSEKLRQITVNPISPIYFNILERKIEELKETTGNRDVNSGGVTGGVTSGAAIATLQEAGNKTSRDAIKADYRAYVKVVRLILELIRQFYSDERVFRITDPNEGVSFISYSNEALKPKTLFSYSGEEIKRTPVFDIAVKAEKNNPFSKLSQNETAAQLYKMGAFNPETASQALIMLSMMDFEGKEEIVQKVSKAAGRYSVSTEPGDNESLPVSYPETLLKRRANAAREAVL